MCRILIDKNPDEAKRLFNEFGEIYFKEVITGIKGVQGRYEMGI